jgi:hypothetical protein
MRPVLAALFDWLTVEEALTCLRDDPARLALRTRLDHAALADSTVGAVPEGQYGDNMLQGLLALRSKFDRITATQKLELNLSMHSRGH